MKGVEIMIPTWPEALNFSKLGGRDYGSSGCGVDSMKLQFRARQVSEGYLPNYQTRCWMDIGMTIFIHKDGQCSVGIAAQEVHSAGIPELEHLIKCLKWAEKRQAKVAENGLKLDSLPFYLMNLCIALGIQRTVEYHGTNVDETYAPVAEALAFIVGECKRRWERMQ
jgi:hypothetical protein